MRERGRRRHSIAPRWGRSLGLGGVTTGATWVKQHLTYTGRSAGTPSPEAVQGTSEGGLTWRSHRSPYNDLSTYDDSMGTGHGSTTTSIGYCTKRICTSSLMRG